MKSKIICILVFTILITTSLSVTGDEENSSESKIIDEYSYNSFFTNLLVRIDTTKEPATIPRDIEIVGGRPGEWIDIIIPRVRLIEPSNSDINYSVLICDIDVIIDNYGEQPREGIGPA